jgi:hypothetical protein
MAHIVRPAIGNYAKVYIPARYHSSGFNGMITGKVLAYDDADDAIVHAQDCLDDIRYGTAWTLGPHDCGNYKIHHDYEGTSAVWSFQATWLDRRNMVEQILDRSTSLQSHPLPSPAPISNIGSRILLPTK